MPDGQFAKQQKLLARVLNLESEMAQVKKLINGVIVGFATTCMISSHFTFSRSTGNPSAPHNIGHCWGSLRPHRDRRYHLRGCQGGPLGGPTSSRLRVS
jgi:hypothetical protein